MFKGFCQNALGLIRLGLFDSQPHPSLQSTENVTWKDLICDLLKVNRDTSTNTLKQIILQKLQHESQLNTLEE